MGGLKRCTTKAESLTEQTLTDVLFADMRGFLTTMRSKQCLNIAQTAAQRCMVTRMAERLTFEGNFCEIARCRETRWGKHCPDGACSQRKVWERLKEYEDALSADVAPVVHCKDCKHLMFSDCYGECGAARMGIVSPDDFCSYGERKNNGNEDRA